jgi:hypothetical protein
MLICGVFMASDGFKVWIMATGVGTGIVIGLGIHESLEKQNTLLAERNRIAETALAYEQGRQQVFFDQRVGDERKDLVVRGADGSERVFEAYTTERGDLSYRAVGEEK